MKTLTLISILVTLINMPESGKTQSSTKIPTGIITAFAGEKSKIPKGWRLCNRYTIKSGDLLELYKVIGTSWGWGDGTKGSFSLPDLEGAFMRE